MLRALELEFHRSYICHSLHHSEQHQKRKKMKKMKQEKIQRLIEYSHFDYGLRSELARTSHPRQRRKRKRRLKSALCRSATSHSSTYREEGCADSSSTVDERSPPKKMNESSSLVGEQAVPSPMTALLKALWSAKLTAANQGKMLEEEKKAFYQAKRRLEDAKKEAGLAAVRQLAAQGQDARGSEEASAKVVVLVSELELAKQALEDQLKEADAAASEVAALDLALAKERSREAGRA
ncbi:hypothetical protein K1719_022133 [Acacia pycnantha]|nr:hypothetical protein K1719_022133 [Acacia pycnantha]